MVKIYEVTDFEQKNNDELDFDLVDDTSVWMRNDPEFYRKEYFPVMSRIADLKRDGKKIDRHKHLGPLIEKGINRYCAQYDLAGSPDEIFKQQDRDALIDKLFGEEMDGIKKGDYK